MEIQSWLTLRHPFFLCSSLLAFEIILKIFFNTCDLQWANITVYVSFLWVTLSKKILEIFFLRETILTCLSGAPMGWIYGIEYAKKSQDTGTLIKL